MRGVLFTVHRQRNRSYRSRLRLALPDQLRSVTNDRYGACQIDGHRRPPRPRRDFSGGVARGFYWQHLVDTGAMKSGSDIARAEGLHPWVPNELMRLTLLAPDIIELLMTGRQPHRMNLI